MQSAQVHYGVAQAHCSMTLFMDVYSDQSDKGIQKMAAWKGWRAPPVLEEEEEEEEDGDDDKSTGEEEQNKGNHETELEGEKVHEAEYDKGSGKISPLQPIDQSVNEKDRPSVSTSDDVSSSDH